MDKPSELNELIEDMEAVADKYYRILNEEFTPRSSNSPPISEIFLKMPSDSDSPLPSNNSGNNFEKSRGVNIESKPVMAGVTKFFWMPKSSVGDVRSL